MWLALTGIPRRSTLTVTVLTSCSTEQKQRLEYIVVEMISLRTIEGTLHVKPPSISNMRMILGNDSRHFHMSTGTKEIFP